MLNKNNLNLNELIGNKNGNLEFQIGDQRYEIRKNATEGEIIIYSITAGIIICGLAPAYIPATIAWTGLLGSLYGIATIIKNSKGERK